MNKKLEGLIIKEHQQTRPEIIEEIRQQHYQAQAVSRAGGMNMPHINPNAVPQERTDVLVMLKFTTIDDRHCAIPEAHRATFEWIWKRPSGQQQWSDFPHWLRKEQGIW